MKFYDYCFYRLSDYYKKKRDSAAEITGSILVSLIQFFTILDIFVILRWVWEFPMPEGINKYWALPIIITLPIINWFRYVKPKKYREFRKQWRQEDVSKRKMKGWLIVLYLAVSIVIPVATGFVKHN